MQSFNDASYQVWLGQNKTFFVWQGNYVNTQICTTCAFISEYKFIASIYEWSDEPIDDWYILGDKDAVINTDQYHQILAHVNTCVW